MILGFLSGACHSSLDRLAPSEQTFAAEVVLFTPGEGAGFGGSSMPEVVLGPPASGSGSGGAASMDVLSLGAGGSIVLGFGDRVIVDGPGPDFIVFENVFQVEGSGAFFQELGEVSIGDDTDEFHVFACLPDETEESCAGKTPTKDFPFHLKADLDPAMTGGDAFDLADLGLGTARLVRIRDVSGSGSDPTAGFDLDAVGLVNWVWVEELNAP
jgi:hypothetical protein